MSAVALDLPRQAVFEPRLAPRPEPSAEPEDSRFRELMSAEHWASLRLCGPCPEHRLTYRDVVPDPSGDPPEARAPRRPRLES